MEEEAVVNIPVVDIKQEQEFHIECSDNEYMDDDDGEEQQEFYDIYEIYELETVEDTANELSNEYTRMDFGEDSSVDANLLGSGSSSESGDDENIDGEVDYSDVTLTDEEDYSDRKLTARAKAAVGKNKDGKSVRRQTPAPRRTEEELKQMMNKIEKVAELYRNPTRSAERVVPVYAKSSVRRTYTDKFLKENYMVWKCPVCDIELQSNHMWRTHLDEAHHLLNRDALHMEYITARKARCLQCKKEMATPFWKLMLHEITHMSNSNYIKCRLCEYRGSNERNVEHHLRQTHPMEIAKPHMTDTKEDADAELNSELIICPYCQRKFDVLAHMLVHVRKVHKFINTAKCLYICPDCGLECGKCPEFHQHLIDAHDYGLKEKTHYVEIEVANNCGVKRSFQCLQCAVIAKEAVKMREHTLMHSGRKCFKCIHCQSRFDTHRELRIHFCAELREEYLARADDLSETRRRRPTNLVYLCPMCGMNFSWKEKRSQHVETAHNMGVPSGLNFVEVKKKQSESASASAMYECTVCARKMKLDMVLMWRHAVTHMPYGCWKCTKCGQSFRNIQLAHTHHCADAIKRAPVRKPNILREYQKTHMVRRFCPMCNKEFENVREFRMHIEHSHDFSTLDGMHMETVDEKYLKCRDCNVLIRNNNAVKYEHRFLHLPYKPYKCKSCGDQFSTLYEVCDHLSSCNEGDDKSISCSSSNNVRTLEASSNSPVSLPIRLTEKFAKIICSLCDDRNFPNREAQLSHFRKEHNFFQEEYIINPNGSMNCKHCNRYFNDSEKKRMLKHQVCHLKNCFLCQLCEYTAQNIRELNEHIKKMHPTLLHNSSNFESLVAPMTTEDPLEVVGNEIAQTTKIRMAVNTERAQVYNEYCEHISYACPECNKPLPTQNDWHAHINSKHSFFDEDKMNFEVVPNGGRLCKDCGVKINGGSLHLQRHRLTHMPYKSFICMLCTHRSNTVNVLIGHIRRRHFTIGKYKCEVCELVLDTPFARYQHIKMHDTKDWPEYLCRVCFQVLSSKHSLISHMTTHDPDRKLVQCKYCDCRYTDSKELKRHTRDCHWDNLGTAEGNASGQSRCVICEEDFQSAEALSVHLQTHDASEIPATVCQICGRTFKTVRSCSTHKRLHKFMGNVGQASEAKVVVGPSKRKPDGSNASTRTKRLQSKHYEYDVSSAENCNDIEMILPNDI